MKRGLWVIDVQNGFVGPQTEFVVPRIEKILAAERFDAVAFTRFVNTADSPHHRLLGWKKMVTPEEQAIDSRLLSFAHTQFEKTVYSAVNEQSLAWLENSGVDQIYLCGIDADCCILKTAADLFESGFVVFVLAEYIASNGGPESYLAALKVMERLIGRNQIITGLLIP